MQRITTHRRRLVAVAASVAALTAACTASATVAGGHDPHDVARFHSRPDLNPPVVSVTTRTSRTSPGYVFFAPKQFENGFPGDYALIQQGPEIMDNRGEVVWFGPIPGSRTQPRDARPHATDFRVQHYRGKPVLTWWQGLSAFGHGDGKYEIYDTSYRKIAEVSPKHGVQGDEHEFLITPRNTALIAFYKPAPHHDLTSLGGDKDGIVLESGVQEIDIATGKVVFEWHSLGRVPLEESFTPIPENKQQPWDYFHLNSVGLEPNGNVLVSARNTHALYEIRRSTGKILWRLGGKKSDFDMGKGTTFAWQHDARRQADGTITLFDNGAAPPVEKFSRALQLRVDVAAKKATLVRAFAHPKKLLSSSQGNQQVLSDGHVVVGWGNNPYITEFDAKGNVLFDAHWTALNSDSYRAYRFPWVGTPTEPPALAARGSGNVTAWASWNGATEVRRWQLLAGSAATSLKPVATVDKKGFETTISAQVGGKFLAVRALDGSGKVLRTSPVLHRDGERWRR